jgi:hypothetical protein
MDKQLGMKNKLTHKLMQTLRPRKIYVHTLSLIFRASCLEVK